VSKLAEQDALDVATWYERRQHGLGEEFLTEVDRSVRALSESALLHRIWFADVRRAPVHRFKFYGVSYIAHEQEVWVLAIFHGRRHPRRLEQRRERSDKFVGKGRAKEVALDWFPIRIAADSPKAFASG
jgi:plasmid stabilization system protein ParE